MVLSGTNGHYYRHLAMIFPSRNQLASKQIRRTGRAEAVTKEGLAATLLPGRQPDQMGQRHSLRPVRPRSCRGALRNGSLMLYFNTNVGATLLRGKGGGWSWLSGCFGPCERAGREPFGHTSRLEPQPRGAVTRRAVAQRRSRASGLTRPLAEAIRGFDSGFGLGFVVGQAVECDHPDAITDNVRPCAPPSPHSTGPCAGARY